MASFKDLLEAKESAKILQPKVTAELTMGSLILSISNIDKGLVNPRQFRRLEAKFRAEEIDYDKARKGFIGYITKTDPSMSSDQGFRDELTRMSVLLEEWESVLDDYNQIIIEQNLEPGVAEAKFSGDHFEALVKQLGLNTQSITEVMKANKSHSRAPKPIQPTFAPKGGLSDYLEFKSFLAKFVIFTAGCQQSTDKLYWLQSSCKGQAYETIKTYSLSEGNYELALEALNKREDTRSNNRC